MKLNNFLHISCGQIVTFTIVFYFLTLNIKQTNLFVIFFAKLFLAAIKGKTWLVSLLLKHKADHTIANNDEKTALDISVQKVDVQSVTMLRLGTIHILRNHF